MSYLKTDFEQIATLREMMVDAVSHIERMIRDGGPPKTGSSCPVTFLSPLKVTLENAILDIDAEKIFLEEK